MKKSFSVFLFVAALLMASPAQAQGVKFGIKGGFNITDMKFDKSSTASSNYQMGKENKNGWYAGLTAKGTLIGGLGFDIAALYDQRETEVIGETIKQQYIYVPLNVRFNIGLGSMASVYLAAGPQFGFNIGDSKIEWQNPVDYAQNKFQLKKSTIGVNVGAGITLLKFLELGAVYNIPLGNTADFDIKNAIEEYDVKSNTFQVSAAIYI
jgi:opacity protein-like surface antigen